MVSIRLSEPFRLVVVGSPDYLEEHGEPQRPEDLLHHECLTFRSARPAPCLRGIIFERGAMTQRSTPLG